MPANSEHVAPASVLIKGTALGAADMALVEKIEVRNYRGLPDMATIRMADPEGTRVAAPPFEIGDAVEIKLGGLDAAQPASIFKGEIVAYEPEFTSSAAILAFRAMDRSHRLQRGRKSRTFQKMSASDIVRKVVGEHGLSAKVESTSVVYDFLQQSMESDLDLLNRLAASANCEFGVTDSTAFLRKDGSAAGPTPLAEWRQNVTSFKPRMSSTQQPGSVKVTGWDPKNKRPVQGSANTPSGLSANGTNARNAAKAFGSAELLVADRVVADSGEANQLAQGTLDKLAGGALEAEGTMQGDPAVQPGGKIKLKGFGAKFDGEHEVSAVTHTYGHGTFKTRFTISGRNPRTLTDMMRPKSERDWANGMIIGLVTNMKDPDGMGRVRVKFPSLGDALESEWARIAQPSAGAGSGLAFRPMIDDEVVVAFEHGDTRRPIVVGFLHNGRDKPPKVATDSNGSKRGGEVGANTFVLHGRGDADINFRNQLVMEAKEKVSLKVVNGNFEVVSDKEVKLDAKSKVELKSQGAIEVSATNALKLKAVSVTVEASSALELKGATVDIKGSGPVNIRGAIINLG
jgi:uncharacterized protein involved in type VI secretion and phage assembly